MAVCAWVQGSKVWYCRQRAEHPGGTSPNCGFGFWCAAFRHSTRGGGGGTCSKHDKCSRRRGKFLLTLYWDVL